MNARIAVLPGDGIGPEVIAEAVATLKAVAAAYGHAFELRTELVGGASFDAYGEPLAAAAIDACAAADAVLLGAVGGPRYDAGPPATRPEAALLRLRHDLGLWANVRPVRAYPELAGVSPLREEVVRGADLVVVRELRGGLYYGRPAGRATADGVRSAHNTLRYDEHEIARIVRYAFGLARRRGGRKLVTSVDKANVLEVSRLWREVAIEVAAAFPDVELRHVLVDTAAMMLVRAPAAFDVVVTENMFGDILTDEASVIGGSIGLLPSASLGDARTAGGLKGMYEPIHGSAPDIEGRGVANPVGAIASAAMLLRESLGLEREAAAVEAAIATRIAAGDRTADIATSRETALSTQASGAAIRAAIERAAA